jgi:hypothetical protein
MLRRNGYEETDQWLNDAGPGKLLLGPIFRGTLCFFAIEKEIGLRSSNGTVMDSGCTSSV